MGDPDAAALTREQSLSSLLDEIRRTVEMEAQIIAAVFPNPPVVMQTFLQRVFAQSVQGFLEVLMARAESGPDASTKQREDTETPATQTNYHLDLAFLRTLKLARVSINGLVNSLKQYDKGSTALSDISNTASKQNTPGAREAAAALTSATSSLGHVLDSAVEELFVPYLEGTLYIERERRSLLDLYAKRLSSFTAVHVSE